MTEQFPDPQRHPWPGAHAGMPAPPGWSPQTPPPAPQPPSRRRGLALAVAGLLILSTALGTWAGFSFGSNGASPVASSGPIVTGDGSSGSSGTTPTTDPTAGIVNINTYTRVFGQSQLVPEGAGSGMVLTPDGEVLTNNHVVQGAWKIVVSVAGQQDYTATVVGVDPTADVALLQLNNASGLATVSTGNPSSISQGAQVAAIGNALGRGGAPNVANGFVTATDRAITAQDPGMPGGGERLTGMIETNANVQPGDSGGALVNDQGQVVGMITAGSAGSENAVHNIGFAIPIDHALTVVEQIRSGTGSSTVLLGERGYLGVAVKTLDPATAARLGVTSGALVVGVEPNGPAANAGMKTPAVIQSVDGQPVGSTDDLGPLLHSHVPGDSVTVRWVDAQGEHTATVQLTSGPAV
ncbi:MAG: S1C family serine protease [Planctomycetaceae bacterium]